MENLNKQTTESTSHYDHLEKMPLRELLINMNKEDKTVPFAVERCIPQIERLVKVIVEKMKNGGRLFYIGAGTSGRLGIVDASECPPTFGVPHDWVIALIAGGDGAIRKAVEFAEDSLEQAWKDLCAYHVSDKDVVIGIAASGRTPYVLGGIKACNDNHITTGCITCNANTPLAQQVQYPIEVITGPEFVTGSTRMKAGTAQKLVLNMISTSVMIQLGKIKGNKMVDMHLANSKLINRAIRMLCEELNISHDDAQKMLSQHGNVRKAIEWYNTNKKNME
ncbi:MAG: N-acetylmuramic acid 6-phosphate etherase [Cytophagaceae bacterium]|nr:N-acetylmuramic acid 6-phosphate etherase [Cytophagaceae bacterium]MDW8456745.1 N-acetylmuramic acid 6-phosphate etherase [Cytophagaceae bacterium]